MKLVRHILAFYLFLGDGDYVRGILFSKKLIRFCFAVMYLSIKPSILSNINLDLRRKLWCFQLSSMSFVSGWWFIHRDNCPSIFINGLSVEGEIAFVSVILVLSSRYITYMKYHILVERVYCESVALKVIISAQELYVKTWMPEQSLTKGHLHMLGILVTSFRNNFRLINNSVMLLITRHLHICIVSNQGKDLTVWA